MSARTAYSPHQSQSSPPAASSPPCTNHALPHALSQAPADARSSVNGGELEQQPPRSMRSLNRRPSSYIQELDLTGWAPVLVGSQLRTTSFCFSPQSTKNQSCGGPRAVAPEL